MSWSKQAECLKHDPELWFQIEDCAETEEALAICGKCPVRFECLTYALGRTDLDGVWGGMTASQRRRFQKKPGVKVEIVERVGASHDLQPCGTGAAYRRHNRAGERPCPACSAWRARDHAEYSRRTA